jgi:guanylate kinase
MALSPEVQARFERAKQHTSTYQPNQQISDALHQKSIVMVVGAVAAGKNFIMQEVCKYDADFSMVSVFTTRSPRKDDDPTLFRYYTYDDDSITHLLDMIETGEIVQYVIHPTSGHIYGTMLEDYKNKFNILPTLSHSVKILEQLPFKASFVLGIVEKSNIWKQHLNQRYADINDKEKLSRLLEAITSLSWSLDSDRIKWIDNSSEGAKDAANTLISIVKQNDIGNVYAREYAQQMLSEAKVWIEEAQA